MADKNENTNNHTIVRTGAYMVRTVVRIALYVIALIVILKGAYWGYSFGYAIFSNQTVDDENESRDVYIQVTEDESVSAVAKDLEREGLIRDDKVFVVQEKLSSYKDQMKPGVYILNTSQTAEEMLAILSQTDTEGQPDTSENLSELKEEAKHDRE